MFPPRPTSPFLILLLGVTSTGLVAEWIRFQVGPLLAVPLALVGLSLTLRAVARAYRARRRWRHALGRRHLHPVPEVSAADGDDARDALPSVRAHAPPAHAAEEGAGAERTRDAREQPERDGGETSVPRGDAQRRDTVI